MKVNLYDLFSNMDEQDIDMIPEQCISSSVNDDVISNVKGRVLDSICTKRKRLPRRMGRVMALAAVICVLVSSLSVGATVYFKPDSNLSQFITIGDDIDISTMGRDMNITADDSGLVFTLKQVLTDNSIMHLELECPELNGEVIYPETIDAYVNGKLSIGSIIGVWDENGEKNIMMITIDGLENIRENSDIEIKLDNVGRLDKDGMFEEIGVDGNWSFKFKSFRSDVKKRLRVEKIINYGESEKYKISNFIISPLGFSFDYKLPHTDTEDEKLGMLEDEKLGMLSVNSFNETPFVIIEMKDGTVYTDIYDYEKDCSNINISASSQIGMGSSYHGSINGVFSETINVNEIKSITVMDNVIYNE